MSMKNEQAPAQPPILKVVGRRAAGSNPLRRLEALSAFIYRYAQDTVSAGELFPVRKAVGRTRQRRG
jgi:hypothetical protein